MNIQVSQVAIGFFLAVIAVTLAITYWAAKRTHTTSDLYSAGGRINAWQNGWAIAGDILSAAVLLGGVGMYFTAGYDALLYAFPVLLGIVIALGVIAGPMRRRGKYTFTDAATTGLSEAPIRIIAAASTLAVLLMYLTAQLLGAGGLIVILFGIPYTLAVIVVGILMVIYVAFGGMLATTWVQIIKALLLVAGVTLLTFLALAQFGFSLDALYAKAATAHERGFRLTQPGGLGLSWVEATSLTLAFAFGIPGMPHLLMRFFTVPDAATARRSLAIGITVMTVVFIMVYLILGPAGVAFVANNPEFSTSAGSVQGGTNMVLLHLARSVGGDVLFGLIAAVAFSTILAVVSGITVAAASALSHDLYVYVIAGGQTDERKEGIIFRVSCVLIGIVGIALAIAFQGQNILFLTGLLFSIAASSCFPLLFLAMFWRPLTTAGAVAGATTGLVLSVGLIIIGPSVWVAVLGNTEAIIPLSQPAIVSVPSAFIVMFIVSLLTRTSKTQASRAPA